MNIQHRFNGEVLKKYRLKKNIKSARQLASEIYKKLNVELTSQSIDNHERGVHEPRLGLVLTYSQFFGVEAKDFYSVDRNNSALA